MLGLYKVVKKRLMCSNIFTKFERDLIINSNEV